MTARGDVHVQLLPIMMFGLPGAALAMYSQHRKKKSVVRWLAGCCFLLLLLRFLTGVTEPLEFLFMFLAPLLYLLHALLTGISLFVATLLGMHRPGFSFSAGAIDYALMYNLPAASQNVWMLLVMGVVFLRYLLRGVQFGYPHVRPENAGW
ncbi:PTS transporter subunit EIIC [Shigella sonnei]